MNQIPPHHQPKGTQERRQQLPLLQWYRKRTLKAKVSLWSVLALILLLLGITVFQQSPLKHKTAGVHISALSLSVKGAQIYNENNQPLLLRGAMIESSFAYINQWQQGKDPLKVLNTSTFNAMAQQWHMNAVRINISQWVYNLNPSAYLTKLDMAVRQANAAGLYVILDFHDNTQSGAVAPSDNGMLHKVSVGWWKTMAAHYLSNPMIMYDLINEPQYSSWSVWLNGDGGDVVGMNAVIAAIRSTGAKQIIVLEPGQAGGGNSSVEGGWATFDPKTITDPSIVYSKHMYDGVITGNPTIWDHEWGALLNTHPIYYGEWAVLSDSRVVSQCKGLTSTNANTLTNTFIGYLVKRNANWTAWDFGPFNLIQDATTFAPTSFSTAHSWVCGDASAAQAGMGTDIKNYLDKNP